MNDAEKNAHQRGVREGTEATERRMRAFTGIEGAEPRNDLPEHIAYPLYARNLQQLHDELTSAVERSTTELETMNNRHQRALTRRDETLANRRNSRQTSSVFVRAASAAGDRFIPEHGLVKSAAEHLRFWDDRLTQQQDWLTSTDKELARVEAWIEQMIDSVDDLKTARAAEEQQRRQDAEWAARDVSPRWCKVYSLEAFLAEDPRRQSRAWGTPTVAGIDFGYRWHRDQDHGPDATGQWSLHVNTGTDETFLEHRPGTSQVTIWLLGTAIKTEKEAMVLFEPLAPRQHERNSLALVLDAYQDYAQATTPA